MNLFIGCGPLTCNYFTRSHWLVHKDLFNHPRSSCPHTTYPHNSHPHSTCPHILQIWILASKLCRSGFWNPRNNTFSFSTSLYFCCCRDRLFSLLIIQDLVHLGFYGREGICYEWESIRKRKWFQINKIWGEISEKDFVLRIWIYYASLISKRIKICGEIGFEKFE